VLCFDPGSLEKGNRPLPWGSLREGWSAIRQGHIVVVVEGPGAMPQTGAELAHLGKARVFRARRSAPMLTDAGGAKVNTGTLSGGRFALVSAIARPASFEKSCLDLGATIPASVRFPDHHWYTDADVSAIREMLGRRDCTGIITTEKDIWKLPDALQGIALVLRTQLGFLEADAFWKNLDDRLGVG
jgi:tetraacyldisaccharide-1-P 4'-kinase